MLTVKRIRYYSIFLMAGLFLSIAFHYSAHKFLGLSYPWDTFLFDPIDRFNDWHNSVFSAATMNPYFEKGVAVSAYFPFSYLLLLMGDCVPKFLSLVVYFTISAILMGLGMGFFWRIHIDPIVKKNIPSNNILILFMVSTLISYPFIFALDRGNLDVWIAGLVLIYIATFRSKYLVLGFISLGLAIAMKGYPLAFLLLAIADRKYLLSLWTIVFSFALTAFALFYFNGGFNHNLIGWLHGLSSYREVYVLGFGSVHFSSDPYNALRLVFMATLNTPLTNDEKYLFLSTYNAKRKLIAL